MVFNPTGRIVYFLKGVNVRRQTYGKRKEQADCFVNSHKNMDLECWSFSIAEWGLRILDFQ